MYSNQMMLRPHSSRSLKHYLRISTSVRPCQSQCRTVIRSATLETKIECSPYPSYLPFLCTTSQGVPIAASGSIPACGRHGLHVNVSMCPSFLHRVDSHLQTPGLRQLQKSNRPTPLRLHSRYLMGRLQSNR